MEGDLQRTLGRNLRTHRQELGLSQEQFAEKLGYHRTYVGGIEQGLRNLSLRSVERLAEVLGVTATDLLQPRAPEVDARENRMGG
ncbi:transcriptional regulator [Rhodococcus sp. 06-1477-1B]|nr:transcriptional regulator [Rhodococcus sp. 06-1477-1B]